MIDTIKVTLAEVKPRFPGKDMAEWKQPVFWKYFDASLETPERPQMAEDAPEKRLSAVLRLGPTMAPHNRSEEHTSELQSLMRISYAVFCLKKKDPTHTNT